MKMIVIFGKKLLKAVADDIVEFQQSTSTPTKDFQLQLQQNLEKLENTIDRSVFKHIRDASIVELSNRGLASLKEFVPNSDEQISRTKADAALLRSKLNRTLIEKLKIKGLAQQLDLVLQGLRKAEVAREIFGKGANQYMIQYSELEVLGWKRTLAEIVSRNRTEKQMKRLFGLKLIPDPKMDQLKLEEFMIDCAFHLNQTTQIVR